ncbi:MAG: S-layer homology domain-containing protein [Chloroflexia bacterium]
MKERYLAAFAAAVLGLLALAFAPWQASANQPAASGAPRGGYSNTVETVAIDTPVDGATATPTSTGTPGCVLAWRATSSPNIGTTSDWLNGVSAISANDVWAVGYWEDYTVAGGKRTLVEHWNGARWEIAPSPNVGDSSQFWAVSALSPHDVWAVGSYLGAFFVRHTLVEHWDGAHWAIVPSPDGDLYSNNLYGVSALAADDVWAVGYTSAGLRSHALAIHWNGTRWDAVPYAYPDTETFSYTGVAAVARDDVWAVGYYDTGGSAQGLIEHWDGGQWTQVFGPKAGNLVVLTGVVALGARDLWTVGYFREGAGPDQTFAQHWDGSQWKVETTPNVGPNANDLWGVTGSASDNVWAVGRYFSDPEFLPQTLVLRWDGHAWSQVESPNPGPRSNELQAVSAASTGDVWAAGQFVNTFDDLTLLERYNSSCATPVPTSTPRVTPTACTTSFTDVLADSPFYANIKYLSCLGIVSGYSDSSFRPNNNVTRGQLAKIVSNAAGFSDTPGPQAFEDVPPNHPFYAHVQRLASRGYISGYACGEAGEPCVRPGNRPYFRPGSDITRGQLAKVVSNTAGFHDPHSLQIFEDIPADHTFYTYTQLLGARLIMDGYRCGSDSEPCMPPYERKYFRPGNNATRGQTSKIVSNAFFPDCSR